VRCRRAQPWKLLKHLGQEEVWLDAVKQEAIETLEQNRTINRERSQMSFKNFTIRIYRIVFLF